MPSQKCPFNVKVAETEDNLVQSLGEILQSCSSEALKSRQAFRVGISGGSLVQFLSRALVSRKLDTKKWKFFFCDERYVPDDDAESTYNAYRMEMHAKLPNIQESQLIKANTGLSLNACACDYAARIIDEFGSSCPIFDLLLLGMGPDGHTCSLFPDRPEFQLHDEQLVIPIRNSPKPPQERITFTMPLINNANNVVFVVTGASKADMVKSVFMDVDKSFPSACVEPTHGTLTLITDRAAGAKFLSSKCGCHK